LTLETIKMIAEYDELLGRFLHDIALVTSDSEYGLPSIEDKLYKDAFYRRLFRDPVGMY